MGEDVVAGASVSVLAAAGAEAVEGSRSIFDELSALRLLASGDGKDGAESSSHCIK